MEALLIDDDTDVQRSLRKVLERAGFQVITVDNGLAALAELRARQFAVLVCDVRMPFMNGMELFKELKEQYPDAARRVVFITAWATDPEIKDFLEESDRPWLRKPFDLGALLATVRGIVTPGTWGGVH
jgi:DNA-binding response OmpR family regulator